MGIALMKPWLARWCPIYEGAHQFWETTPLEESTRFILPGSTFHFGKVGSFHGRVWNCAKNEFQFSLWLPFKAHPKKGYPQYWAALRSPANSLTFSGLHGNTLKG